MRRRFAELAFTPAVRAEQERHGSRAAKLADAEPAVPADALGEQEFTFIAARDSFYLASVSETGWPYVQHRGGPVGFVRHVDERTIGWADYVGNRQYVSAGNTAANDRVAMIFMDYPHQERLKLLGHLQAYEAKDRQDLAPLLGIDGYRARVERFVLVTVEAFDWNCPQHITPRFALAEIEELAAPLRTRIAELETQLAERK